MYQIKTVQHGTAPGYSPAYRMAQREFGWTFHWGGFHNLTMQGRTCQRFARQLVILVRCHLQYRSLRDCELVSSSFVTRRDMVFWKDWLPELLYSASFEGK